MNFSVIVLSALYLICFTYKAAATILVNCTLNGSSSICKCETNGSVITCYGNNELNYIPKFSPNITYTELRIFNGDFKNLSKSTFENVKANITALKLIKCGIKHITNDAFQSLVSLEELNLSKNYKGLNASIAAESFHSLSKTTIKTLSLNWMNWMDIPPTMFDGLVNTSVTKIRLSHNLIRHINGSLFSKLKSLQELDLSWNGLTDTSMNFSGLAHITVLDLSGNWYFFVPNFCNEQNTSYTPNLQSLSLGQTKIQSLSNEIRCLDELRNLSLSGITIRRLYNNTFSKMKSLEELKLANLGSQLLLIEPAAFNSSSLKRLQFSMAKGYKFTDKNIKHFNVYTIFVYCPNLTYLDLSHNIFDLNLNNIISMFKPIENLTSLTLRNTKIRNIPYFGNVLHRLHALDLSWNVIEYWKNSEPFDNLTCLRKLALTGNKISLPNETSFPQFWFNRTENFNLTLKDNPFSCSCRLEGFLNWIRKEGWQINTDSEKWICANSMKKVIEYDPSRSFICLVEYTVPAILMLCISIVSGFLLYLNRWRIRLKIFKCRSRKKTQERLLEDEHLFDCFVAYSYDDLSWVQNQLIEKLEAENNLRLCIRDRDFQLGTVFSNHIVDSIGQSKTVLLLLSENFAKDQWCYFQFAVASHMNVTKGKPTIIPLVLENIRFSVMTEPIYNILHNMECIRWQTSDTGQQIFWGKILNTLSIEESDEENVYNSFFSRQISQ